MDFKNKMNYDNGLSLNNKSIKWEPWTCPVCGRGMAPGTTMCDHGGTPNKPPYTPDNPYWPYRTPINPWVPDDLNRWICGGSNPGFICYEVYL